MSNVTIAKQELAREALNLQIQLDQVTADLEAKKQELRDLANGKILNIVVEGLGKIDVTEPRAGTEKTVFTINEDKLGKVPDLRSKLIERGIAKEVLVINEEKLVTVPELRQKMVEKGVMSEETKMISAAKASVRIKPNV